MSGAHQLALPGLIAEQAIEWVWAEDAEGETLVPDPPATEPGRAATALLGVVADGAASEAEDRSLWHPTSVMADAYAATSSARLGSR